MFSFFRKLFHGSKTDPQWKETKTPGIEKPKKPLRWKFIERPKMICLVCKAPGTYHLSHAGNHTWNHGPGRK